MGYSAVVGPNATFSSRPPKAQYQGYFQYQLKDQESNLTPYAASIYLGKKKVLNVGAGLLVQPQAVRYRASATRPDTAGQGHAAVRRGCVPGHRP